MGVLVSLLSVPLTIGYLGEENVTARGSTLASLLAWLELDRFRVGQRIHQCSHNRGGARSPRSRSHARKQYIFPAYSDCSCNRISRGNRMALHPLELIAWRNEPNGAVRDRSRRRCCTRDLPAAIPAGDDQPDILLTRKAGSAAIGAWRATS